jgi:hypothetical protein
MSPRLPRCCEMDSTGVLGKKKIFHRIWGLEVGMKSQDDLLIRQSDSKRC